MKAMNAMKGATVMTETGAAEVMTETGAAEAQLARGPRAPYLAHAEHPRPTLVRGEISPETPEIQISQLRKLEI